MVSKKKPDDLSIGYFITIIAKYYFNDCLNSDELSDKVKKILLEFDLDNYQEYKYHNKITSVCDGLFDGSIKSSFRIQEYIPIYENELNFIHSLQNDKQKKLMFTLFAIARYMNCDGWINKKTSKDISEVFKLANLSLTPDKRNQLLHDLYTDGYISFGKRVNNLNIKVNLDDSGDVLYKVKDFTNIGNQYIGNFKKGYKQCKQCGKVIRNTGNKKMYCEKCANESLLKSYIKHNNKVRN